MITTCEEAIKDLLSIIFGWYYEFPEERDSNKQVLIHDISKTRHPCQNFISYLLLILKGRTLNPDEHAPEFQNPKVRGVIHEYYEHRYHHYYGNRFRPVIYKTPEQFPLALMEFVIEEWKNGNYHLEYFFTVQQCVGTLLFTPDSMVYGLKLAETKLNLDEGTLVKDWEYLLTVNEEKK